MSIRLWQIFSESYIISGLNYSFYYAVLRDVTFDEKFDYLNKN